MNFEVISSNPNASLPGFYRTKIKHSFVKDTPLGKMPSSVTMTFNTDKQHVVGSMLDINPADYTIKESQYYPNGPAQPGIKQLHLHPKMQK